MKNLKEGWRSRLFFWFIPYILCTNQKNQYANYMSRLGFCLRVLVKKRFSMFYPMFLFLVYNCCFHYLRLNWWCFDSNLCDLLSNYLQSPTGYNGLVVSGFWCVYIVINLYMYKVVTKKLWGFDCGSMREIPKTGITLICQRTIIGINLTNETSCVSFMISKERVSDLTSYGDFTG